MVLKYKPKGTCSTMMEVEVVDGIINYVKVTGGCSVQRRRFLSAAPALKDPEELERVYQIGRRIASDASEKIRRFLSKTTAG